MIIFHLSWVRVFLTDSKSQLTPETILRANSLSTIMDNLNIGLCDSEVFHAEMHFCYLLIPETALHTSFEMKVTDCAVSTSTG
jgi:hypothetical protein